MPTKEDLRVQLRNLWHDHSFYTQITVISAIDNLQSLNIYLNRYLKNQDDIGQTFGFFYGPQAGNSVSHLLRNHVNAAVGIVNAAKSGDMTSINNALNVANQNNIDIATGFNTIDPMFDMNTIFQFMDTHVKLVTQAASANIMEDFQTEINALDSNNMHLNNFADYQTNIMATRFGLM